MKTYKHLFPQICDFDNLYNAFIQARRGKRRQPNVAAFEFDLEENLVTLQEELQQETYRPGQYTHFTLYEKKPRRISAAPFRDRVVHHALTRVIDPIWERRFIYDSYACRKRKGTHAALDRVTYFARRYPYVLQCDVVQFFPSIDHAILEKLLARRIADDKTIRLCRHIIASGRGIHNEAYQMQWFPGDDLLAAARPRGLPIGNQTSQFWANVYLHELDKFVKERLRCRAYLRYVDDVLLFAENKPTLHRWREEISRYLQTLRLLIHPNKSRVYPVTTGIPFLGFVVYPEHRRLQRSAGVHFARRYRRKVKAYAAGKLSLERLRSSVHGWLGHTRHGDTYGLRRAILSGTPIPPPRGRER
jgi:retron-type reverse transcriptase